MNPRNPFNRDLTKQGFDDGINDAKAHKPKDVRGVMRHGKTWVWGNDAIDSYSMAYDQGYASGLAINHNVYYPKSIAENDTATSGDKTMPFIAPEPIVAAALALAAAGITALNTENNNPGENTVSDTTSFVGQIELLEDLKTYLNNFQERLLGVSANYARKVDSLRDAGMMKETYEHFIDEQLAPTQTLIQRLVEHIEHNDIPAVQRAIAHLEEGL